MPSRIGLADGGSIREVAIDGGRQSTAIGAGERAVKGIEGSEALGQLRAGTVKGFGLLHEAIGVGLYRARSIGGRARDCPGTIDRNGARAGAGATERDGFALIAITKRLTDQASTHHCIEVGIVIAFFIVFTVSV